MLDDFSGVGDLVEADEGVHLGHLAREFLRKTLRHAAADDQFLPGFLAQAALLVRLEDRLDGFLLRGVDERAGVHDEHVGVFRICGDLHAALDHAAKHDLGIDQVLGAAEADDADFNRAR